MSDTDTQARIAELEEQLQREMTTRKRLVEIATQLSSTLNLQELLQLIMASAAELLDAEASSLLLLDDETNELWFEVATGGTAENVVKRRMPATEGIAGWALQHREAVVLDDPSSDSRFYSDVGAAIGFETDNLVALPLLVKDRAIGVVEVINKRKAAGFSEVDLDIATALASLAAIALDNASMYARLADAVVAARMSYRL